MAGLAAFLKISGVHAFCGRIGLVASVTTLGRLGTELRILEVIGEVGLVVKLDLGPPAIRILCKLRMVGFKTVERLRVTGLTLK